MRRNRLKMLLLLLWTLLPPALRAQDAMPLAAPAARCVPDQDTLMLYAQRTDTLPVPFVGYPSAFRQVGENALRDSLGQLHPFWERLRLLRAGASGDTLRVVHIGDSHVRGHIFPRTAGEWLQRAFGALAYTDMGINGAFCTTFTRPERIRAVAALHPDLLILSFGTNESHNRRYDPQAHYRQMDELVRLLREQLPDVPLLLTTPPGSYESQRQRGRRRTYRINPRTDLAVRTICRYADDHGLAVWDMYNLLGGAARACLNWQEARLMRPDHVHYLPEGYCLQGELLAQALIKAYNDYVEY